MTSRVPPSGSPVPADRFLGALRASRLLAEDQLAGLDRTPPDAGADGRDLARLLVTQGLLTPFQADRLLRGHPDGLVLGHYRVLAPLGAGGMGEIYLAEHELLRRRVALKVLAEHLVRDAAAVARFRWEVQVAARLSHPNVVAVHDAGEAAGRHFLVMEYVDGVDLARLVGERGPLPVGLACECVRQGALGLQHAYAAGFVHCDVKPSNFLLTRNPGPDAADGWAVASPYFTPLSEFRMVKLVDLGLARRLGADADGPGPADDLAGSADYLAPEQARGPRPADVRSDLYGLGCTFYFLLTGRAPFAGGAWPDKLLRHQLDQPTPVRTLRPDVPAAVEAVVTRLTCKDPAGRYAVPAEVAVDLHEWLAEHGERPTPESPAPPNGRSAARTHAVLAAPTVPVLADIPAVQQPRVPVLTPARLGPLAASPPANGRGTLWLALAGLAVFLGLASAGVLHYVWRVSTDAPPAAAWASRPVSFVSVSGRPEESYAGLAAAVDAAQDGDTLVLHGEGPFPVRPLSVRDKALTIRAAGLARPRLYLAGPSPSWQPMLSTDRAMHLEGVELWCPEAGKPSAADAGHLVYAEGATVTLRNCRLVSAAGCGLVVVRHGPAVALEGCEVVGHGAAVVIEVGAAPVELTLADCRVRCTGAGAPAVTVWAPDSALPGAVRLELTGSTVQAGRVAAFTGLPRQVVVTARDNVLAFREALVSFADCPGADDWRRATRWQGGGNRYRAAAEWLTVDGRSLGVRGLEQWRGLWQDAEAGSVEEAGQVVGRLP